MKKLILITILLGLMATPALGVATITFADATAGTWTYTAASSTFTFANITIGSVEGGTSDPLMSSANAYVDIPDMTVTGSTMNWTLSGGTIYLRDSSNNMLMTGNLAAGPLNPSGKTGTGYPLFKMDILVTAVDNSGISSPALARIEDVGRLDFEMTLSGGPTSPSEGFDWMLQQTSGGPWNDGMSGSLDIIPAPGAVLLGGIGIGLVGWLRRRRTL